HVERGMEATPANAVASWGERDMGNPKTLVDFVDWTRANYPADRYALFFWGHSWSWHPGVTMWDATSHDALNAGENRSVLPQLGFIDMIGYDSCNAGAIETEALWRGHAAAIWNGPGRPSRSTSGGMRWSRRSAPGRSRWPMACRRTGAATTPRSG